MASEGVRMWEFQGFAVWNLALPGHEPKSMGSHSQARGIRDSNVLLSIRLSPRLGSGVRDWVRIGFAQARGSLTGVHCCLESP